MCSFSVSERLRTPLSDWYETWRKTLEREAREARNVHRQALAVEPAGEPLPGRARGADVAATLSIEGIILCGLVRKER